MTVTLGVTHFSCGLSPMHNNVSNFARIQKTGVHMPIAELQLGRTPVIIPTKAHVKKCIL